MSERTIKQWRIRRTCMNLKTKQLGPDMRVHVDDVSDGGDELSAGELHGRGPPSRRPAPAGRVCLRYVLPSFRTPLYRKYN